jgi:hypothetical protein
MTDKSFQSCFAHVQYRLFIYSLQYPLYFAIRVAKDCSRFRVPRLKKTACFWQVPRILPLTLENNDRKCLFSLVSSLFLLANSLSLLFSKRTSTTMVAVGASSSASFPFLLLLLLSLLVLLLFFCCVQVSSGQESEEVAFDVPPRYVCIRDRTLCHSERLEKQITARFAGGSRQINKHLFVDLFCTCCCRNHFILLKDLKAI